MERTCKGGEVSSNPLSLIHNRVILYKYIYTDMTFRWCRETQETQTRILKLVLYGFLKQIPKNELLGELVLPLLWAELSKLNNLFAYFAKNINRENH